MFVSCGFLSRLTADCKARMWIFCITGNRLMYLIERKPTLSDFFGIAVNTTSRQASGLSVSQPPKRTRNRRYSQRRVDQLRARTISTTTPSDPGLFAHFSTCQGIEKVVELYNRHQTLHLYLHIVVVIAINFATMIPCSSSPRVSVRRGTIW